MTESSFRAAGTTWSGLPRFLDGAPCRLEPSLWAVDGVEQVEAYLICLGCSVRADCRAYALNTPELSGIWAATTKEERAGLRRRWESSTVNSASVDASPTRFGSKVRTLAAGLRTALRRVAGSSEAGGATPYPET